MAKTFDAATKELIKSNPRDWARLIARTEARGVKALNVDLTAISPEADCALLVEDGGSPWIIHLEIQSGYDSTLPRRLQRYNVLVGFNGDLPVRSIALLLCREADGPALTGRRQCRLPNGTLYHDFRYEVYRLWEQKPEEFLNGGLATLPLAPLTAVADSDLPGLIARMQRRINREATGPQSQVLWLATFLLMGLTKPSDQVKTLLKGVNPMKESSTYQYIINEGRKKGRKEGKVEEAKAILKRQGTKRFGKPSRKIAARLEAVDDLKQLETLTDRVLDATSWDDLLEGIAD